METFSSKTGGSTFASKLTLLHNRLIISLLFITHLSLAQTCPGNFFLTSQADVDNFVTNYGCKIIQGNLTIGTSTDDPSTDISNLNGLSGIIEITGQLRIINNPLLSNLKGLNNLKKSGGFFIIKNDLLNDISAFSGLQMLSGIIQVWDNDNLVSFNLASVPTQNIYDVRVAKNDKLQVAKLPVDITSIAVNIQYHENDKLHTISDMPNLTSVGGVFQITDFHGATFPNFASLQIIGGGKSLTRKGLALNNSSKITSIPAFSALSTLKGFINIGHNKKLQSFNLSGVHTSDIFNIHIVSNEELWSAKLPTDITEIKTFFDISSNPKLTELLEMPKLTTVNWYLTIAGTAVYTLPNFCNLNYIGQDDSNSEHGFKILNNANITTLPSLSPSVTIKGQVYIADNPNLSNCSTLGVCNYLKTPNANVDINYNTGACINQAAVELACENPSNSSGCCGALVVNNLESNCSTDNIFELAFSLHNFSNNTVNGFNIGNVPGFNFSNQHWTVSIPPGGTAGPFYLTITPLNLPAPNQICLDITYFLGSLRRRMQCDFEHCLALVPFDPCQSLNVNVTDHNTEEGCCYKAEVVNEECDDFFVGIQTEIITPGSIFNSHAAGADWNPVVDISNTKINWWASSGFISVGATPGIAFCIAGNQSTHQVVFHWLYTHPVSGQPTIVCSDTIEVVCDPNLCLEIQEEEPFCDGNGNYSLLLTMINNSVSTISFILLDAITPGIAFNPPYAKVMVNPGGTFSLTTTISSTQPLNPGDVIAYRIIIIYEDGGCCELDNLNFTIPNCESRTRGKINEKGNISVENSGAVKLYPNPAQDRFFVQLPKLEGKSGTIRVHNLLGQEITSEIVSDFNGEPIEVLLGNISSFGQYFVTVEVDGHRYPPKNLMINSKK